MVAPTMLTPDQASDGQAGHTPGPWVVIHHPEPRCAAHTVGRPGGEYADGHATVWGFHPHNSEANARLISAAPDMLEALTLAEDVLSRFPFTSEIWPNGLHPNAGISTIRAAIAKATGK